MYLFILSLFIAIVSTNLLTDNANSPNGIYTEEEVLKALVEKHQIPEEVLKNLPENVKMEEDALLTVTQLLQKYGYPVEEHQVVTEDNYILTMHRVPYGRNVTRKKDKVVFLMHGILSSSADWIISGVHKGLAYILADEGYDVWMGNARGNHLSRNHTTLSPASREFWQFSWHEIGVHDLPTMIDHILAQTGKEQLFYVGHSQGTTAFYVMCAERPEYNAKILAQFSLAPIAFMNHMTSPLFHIIAFWNGPLSVLLNLIGMNEFLPNNKFMAEMGDVLCGRNSITKILCTNSLFAICGFSYREMNASLLPILMGHTPAGSSTKQFLHYAQEINSGHFRQYDYGLFGNMHRYNSMVPPNYRLDKVSAPVYLMWSHNDWLSAERDVYKLYKRLRNCKGKFLIADNSFNHLDYMFGINAPDLVYNKLISLMTRH